MEDIEGPRKVVRIYSFHAQERLPPTSDAHTLGRILSTEEPSLEDIIEPWRRFFEPYSESDPITAVLSVEAEKLRQQWIEFQRGNSKEDRVDVGASEPTMQGVICMVADAGKVWQAKKDKGKRGKAITYFHRLCGALDRHSNMLETIPKGNEYVSIFAGTITTLIKASVNHENIAEELSQALWMISEHSADCEVEMELFRTEAMQRAVADLYAHIFLFLTDTLSWYMKKRRKRMMDSFNERFLQEFECEIDNIKRKSEIIKRKAAQHLMAEQRVTRLTVEETRKDLRLGLEGVMRTHAETMYYAQHVADQIERQRVEQQEVKNNVAQLYRNIVKFLTDSAQSEKGNVSLDLESEHIMNPRAVQGANKSRDDLHLNSASLEDFFQRDRVRLECDLFVPTPVDPEAVSCLAEWTRQLSSFPILSIASRDFSSRDELENPMTILAAKFIDFAAASNIPLVSYFCELKRGERLQMGNTLEMQGLMSLFYGILRQMIELAPPEFKSSKDFSKERFEKLDGSVHSWDHLTSVFRDVQDILPGKLFCVIDGLQWLDDASTSSFLAQFVEMLRRDNFKVLITTTGQSQCLLDCLTREELLILERPRGEKAGSLWKFEEGVLEL
ncbi:uncharacterized protein BDR25DRAFT_271045 [Lindgomyces ingoldianus]|uniref:Uncharacterized protein n=1 Tax=Lindgomyces ingoldianus TaxID=673940 RepID=A0ACB6QD50_9PLEO|nr:uncharacterized protein BDR25DRAFT_271045 [Lindgomyces ingoldianus]KAF2464831.1 hypothetical protein BDR25DRAFT_271045 [Lindgomyces ingoldianus]